MTILEDIELQACESCQKEYSIEQVHTMEGCWICDGCYAEWKAEFDKCEHDWSPYHDEYGEPGKVCNKCSGFVAGESTGLALVSADPPVRELSDGASRPSPWDRELIKAIAMDIGKEVAAYIEVMYPKAVTATSSTFLLAVRNSIYNQIMAAIDVSDEGQIKARLQDRKVWRRQWKATYKKIRAKNPASF